MNIKAIETSYNGYLFRSRLEARWAVFFDSLGVAWEYEKEGYELSTGKRYLPDFWLPDENIWVEVKGKMPDDEYLKMLETFSSASGQALLLVIGMPGATDSVFWGFDSTDSSAGSYYANDVSITDASDGRLQFSSLSDRRLSYRRTVFADESFANTLNFIFLPNRLFSKSVNNAIVAAKSERFEKGVIL